MPRSDHRTSPLYAIIVGVLSNPSLPGLLWKRACAVIKETSQNVAEVGMGGVLPHSSPSATPRRREPGRCEAIANNANARAALVQQPAHNNYRHATSQDSINHALYGL